MSAKRRRVARSPPERALRAVASSSATGRQSRRRSASDHGLTRDARARECGAIAGARDREPLGRAHRAVEGVAVAGATLNAPGVARGRPIRRFLSVNQGRRLSGKRTASEAHDEGGRERTRNHLLNGHGGAPARGTRELSDSGQRARAARGAPRHLSALVSCCEVLRRPVVVGFNRTLRAPPQFYSRFPDVSRNVSRPPGRGDAPGRTSASELRLRGQSPGSLRPEWACRR
jgi:hypothetical protein